MKNHESIKHRTQICICENNSHVIVKIKQKIGLNNEKFKNDINC